MNVVPSSVSAEPDAFLPGPFCHGLRFMAGQQIANFSRRNLLDPVGQIVSVENASDLRDPFQLVLTPG